MRSTRSQPGVIGTIGPRNPVPSRLPFHGYEVKADQLREERVQVSGYLQLRAEVRVPNMNDSPELVGRHYPISSPARD